MAQARSSSVVHEPTRGTPRLEDSSGIERTRVLSCQDAPARYLQGLVVGLVVVVAIEEEVIVGWSYHVVMGVIQKGFTTKNGCRELVFGTVATRQVSWEVLCTHRNELLHEPLHPQNTSSELTFTDCSEQS